MPRVEPVRPNRRMSRVDVFPPQPGDPFSPDRRGHTALKDSAFGGGRLVSSLDAVLAALYPTSPT